jgi:predicted metal-dependent hydrolase
MSDALRVEVVRSTRRKRSVGARLEHGVVKVTVPSWMSQSEEEDAVREMVRRFERKIATQSVDLSTRAHDLASAHLLPLPSSIEWSDKLTAVWGLCTPLTGEIKISSRLVGVPTWVLDYVIVHELAHLVVDDNGPDFWHVVNRYPRAERAIGYLIAKSGDDESPC